MEWSKLKNLAIILLLLLNLFFLLLNAGQARRESEIQASVQENAIEIVHNQGIQLDPEIVPWDSQLKAYVQSRERYEERSLAEQLVGNITEEISGTTWRFYGERGVAEFYQYGNFIVRFSVQTLDWLQATDQAEAHAVALMKEIGIQTMVDSTRSDDKKVYLWQTVDGLPVFTCEFKLSYQQGRLSAIDGRRLAGPLEPGTDHLRTAATMLVSLAEAKAEGSIQCSKVFAIQEGYMNQGAVPVWRLVTDDGDIYLDCVTGEVRLA